MGVTRLAGEKNEMGGIIREEGRKAVAKVI